VKVCGIVQYVSEIFTQCTLQNIQVSNRYYIFVSAKKSFFYIRVVQQPRGQCFV